ncbi:hypothetical protein [Neisseria sicca]|uniref:hypothetical protein n=1 Tax=Neisseria sicca TaxID=490 RepID=UPI00131BFC96|nr:hypothetical protein [Neisseria sicca]MBF1286344.1 hypothetical protein [Neisseria sp.]
MVSTKIQTASAHSANARHAGFVCENGFPSSQNGKTGQGVHGISDDLSPFWVYNFLFSN